MTATRWPHVAAALVTQLDQHADLTGIVHWATPTTGDDTPRGVFVGAFLDDPGNAGDFRQDWDSLGGDATREDRGAVRVTVLSTSGEDGDYAAVSADAFTLLAAVETTLAANPSLGVDGLLWVDLDSGQVAALDSDQDGTWCELHAAVRYTAIINP